MYWKIIFERTIFFSIVLLCSYISFLIAGCVTVTPKIVQVESKPPVQQGKIVTEKIVHEAPKPSAQNEQPQKESNTSPSPGPVEDDVTQILEASSSKNETVVEIGDNDNIEAILQASLQEKEIPSTEPIFEMSPEDIIAHYETEKEQTQPLSDYTLQPSDVIEISVQGEDLTREIIIPPDGIISFFLVGQIKVTDLSIENLRLEIENRLSDTLPLSNVIIRGKSMAGGAAEILGAVNLPGYKRIQPGDRLSDLLAKAGGLWPYSLFDEPTEMEMEADPANAYFERSGIHHPINLFAFLEEGNIENNPEIQSGDFIYIPRRSRRNIFIIGEINQPIVLEFRPDFTLQDAVSLAGGVRQNTFGKDIFLIRGPLTNLEVMRLSYQAIVNGVEEDIPLLPGDILFAPKTFVFDLSKLPLLFLPQLDALLRGEHKSESDTTY